MRWVIAANRLPVTVAGSGKKFRFQKSSGGLVSSLEAFLNPKTSQWVGWPGTVLSACEKRFVSKTLLKDYSSIPVWLSKPLVEKFYYGFCNKTLWPLFHYFPSMTVFDADQWFHYQLANRLFSEVLLEVSQADEWIWVHDYQLFLLPKLLRDKRPDQKIGFFLHIPFPAYEVYRLLPTQWGSDILEGMLSADLIGFHTHEDTQNFLRCALRLLGRENQMGKVVSGSHLAKVDTYPLGIDVEKFKEAIISQTVQNQKENLLKTLHGRRAIFSLDRLDYTKGILQRLLGYERFLVDHSFWRGKVVLILVVIPSRTGVEQYQAMKRQIDEAVGRINGRFGQLGWVPILYHYRSLPFEWLLAHYAASDVALITPLRDGMNLVAKEYVTCRPDQTGVLILSYMAGAAKELSEALLINPNSQEEISQALLAGLTMETGEQQRRMRLMQQRLNRHDVVRWGNHFMEDWKEIREEQKQLCTQWLRDADAAKIFHGYKEARTRLLLLDYDGTLVPLGRDPLAQSPPSSLQQCLKKLGRDPNNKIVVISGRDRDILSRWFDGVPIGLVAEHGAWIRSLGGVWEMPVLLDAQWKPKVLPLLEAAMDRLPGTFIEEKEFSIVWHYRSADPELAPLRVQELIDALISFMANLPVYVSHGNKIVEVRQVGVHKGTAVLHFLSQGPYSFVFAAGDDTTDEDLFQNLPAESYSIRVGLAKTRARFNVKNYEEVVSLLLSFASLRVSL